MAKNRRLFDWYHRHCFDYQMYWKSWAFGYQSLIEPYFDSYGGWCDLEYHFLFIGPLQVRWMSG